MPMKKIAITKKLELSTTTIATLTPSELQGAAGGMQSGGGIVLTRPYTQVSVCAVGRLCRTEG